MSLNHDISKIKNRKELCFVEYEGEDAEEGDKMLNPITQTLIFKTMSIGMGEITLRNWKEFYERVRFVQKLDGIRHQTNQDEGKLVITPTDVYQHIGLTTNVWPKESTSAWLKRMFSHEQRNSRWEYAEMEKVN